MEAVIGVVPSQVKECQQPGEVGRGSLETPECDL